jgi:hypothetical protein
VLFDLKEFGPDAEHGAFLVGDAMLALLRHGPLAEKHRQLDRWACKV